MVQRSGPRRNRSRMIMAALAAALGAALLLSAPVGAIPNAALPPGMTLVSNHTLLVNPAAIATDGANLYVGEGNRVLSVPIGGGAATVLFASATPCCVQDLTVLGSNLYWIDPNGDPDATAIFRAPVSGGTITKVYSGFATGQPIVDGSGITNDGAKLYTSDHVQGRVHSLNADGTGITEIASRYGGFFDLEHFNGIAHADGVLYIVDEGDKGFPPAVFSIPIGGGSFTTLHVGAPLVHPDSIAVGNGVIYLGDAAAGNTIWKLPIAGGPPTAFFAGAPFVHIGRNGILVRGGSLYATDSGDSQAGPGPGAVYRLALAQTAVPGATVPGLTLLAAAFLIVLLARKGPRLVPRRRDA